MVTLTSQYSFTWMVDASPFTCGAYVSGPLFLVCAWMVVQMTLWSIYLYQDYVAAL